MKIDKENPKGAAHFQLPPGIDPDKIAFVTTIIIEKNKNGQEWNVKDMELLRDSIRALLDRNPDLMYHILTGVGV